MATIASIGGSLAITLPGAAVAAPQSLHVSGNRLVNASGSPVRLKGVNIPSLEWSNGGENISQSLSVATTTWHSSLIRLPISQDRWEGRAGNDANAYRALVDSLVTAASNAGVYVLVDLHWSDEGVWGANLGQHFLPDDNTTAAWADIASHYKNNPAVLFDAYNEPHDVSWSIWRNGGWVSEGPGYHSPGMQGIVNTIRSTGAGNVIVVGGLDWSYDLTGVMNGYAISDGNIMYAAHIYPWKSNWDQYVTVAAASYPILIGEFGDDASDAYTTWMPAILGWMDSHNYNATAWSFHPGASPCLITDWSYSPTYWFGSYVLPWLGQGTTVPESPFSGTPAAIPGVVQAENYDLGGEGVAYHDTDSANNGGQYRNDGVDIEATTDTGGYDIGWTAAGEWMKYTVTVASAGAYQVAFRVASGASGGTLALLDANGNNLTGAVTVPATGGWQTWTTVSANVTLPAGQQVIELYTSSGGFNLNSLSFANGAPSAPSQVSAASGNAQIALSWSASAGAASYNLYRSTTAGGEGTTAYKTGIAATSFTDIGLTNGVTYYYKVAAVNGNGISAPSGEVSGTPSGNTNTGITSGGTYKLTHAGTGMCLDVASNSSAANANVDQWNDNGTTAQQWVITDMGGGYYKLNHKGTNQCLDVSANSAANQANVDQYTDNGTDAQRWQIVALTNGNYKLIHKGTNQCLDVASNSTAAGANVDQYADNGTTAQQWVLTLIAAP